MTTTLEATDAVLLLGALIRERRAAFKRPLTISLAIAEHGTHVLDTRRDDVAAPGWKDDADLSIFCDAKTLSDLLLGRLDPAAPAEGQLLLWSGEVEDWRTLSSALAGGTSMLGLRAQLSKER